LVWRGIAYCHQSDKVYEIIVVDDGSRDATYDVAASFKAKFDRLRVMKNTQNSGKGYSVKTGFLSARGDIQVFLDADGSTQPEEIERNIHYFDKGYLRYDYIVKQGGDPRNISFDFEGEDGLSVNNKVDLVFQTRFGQVAQKDLTLYQMIDGVRDFDVYKKFEPPILDIYKQTFHKLDISLFL